MVFPDNFFTSVLSDCPGKKFAPESMKRLFVFIKNNVVLEDEEVIVNTSEYSLTLKIHDNFYTKIICNQSKSMILIDGRTPNDGSYRFGYLDSNLHPYMWIFKYGDLTNSSFWCKWLLSMNDVLFIEPRWMLKAKEVVTLYLSKLIRNDQELDVDIPEINSNILSKMGVRNLLSIRSKLISDKVIISLIKTLKKG